MIRAYEPSDLDHCIRILREVGWMEGKDTDKECFELYISETKTLVAELHGEVEVFAATRPGSIRYLDGELPFSGVTGVATSRIARQQGIASQATALAIANSAIDGAALSILGIFDQGYYDKLGYGNLPYMRIATFDPASLNVPRLTRAPKRLGKDDATAMHNCRLHRKRTHGGCNLDGVGVTAAETIWEEKAFGLGFEDDNGTLTHFVWMKSKGEHGPYNVWFTAWETHAQFIELLSVLKSLSDQVHGIRMVDPPRFQLQDFLHRPLATQRIRKGGDFDSATQCLAWAQCRILDVPTCIGAMKLRGESISFNMELTDPIVKYLPDDCGWRGVGEQWTLSLGEKSSATQGIDASLPTVTTTINDLTRLWTGSSSADSLAVTGTFKAEQKLIDQIDDLVRLPTPILDWEF